MRTRSEIELEKTQNADKVIPDGTEVPQLLALLIEVALDCRDALAAPRRPVPMSQPGAENWER